MKTQSNRRSAPQPAKLRREYLATKAKAQAQVTFGMIITVSWGLLTTLCVTLTIQTVIMEHPFFLIFAIPSIVLGAITYWAAKSTMAASEELNSLTPVPPVKEQIAALPEVRVLVRGAELPKSEATLLVRAAEPNECTSANELLRPTI